MLDERTKGPVPGGSGFYMTLEDLLSAIQMWSNENSMIHKRITSVEPVDKERVIVRYKLED